jgi:4-hydroxybenzoate polyprenyltransferase
MVSVPSPNPTSLAPSSQIQERWQRGELTSAQVRDFEKFLAEVDRIFLHHPIVLHNDYTIWFQEGTAIDSELRHFLKQFSVFSNQFLIAALLKAINAPTLEQSRTSREILLNELGVIYRKSGQSSSSPVNQTNDRKDREGDPELVSTEGTVDGGICRFRAAHFEWLIGVAEGLELHYKDIGQRKHGRPTTLYFCDELQRLYGSDDPNIAEGASFAVENWAAAGFWQQLEDGLTRIKQNRHPHLKLAFFTWHNRVEAQHAGHTLEELEEVYFKPGFDRAKFLQGGREILTAIAVFWDGLNCDRQSKIQNLTWTETPMVNPYSSHFLPSIDLIPVFAHLFRLPVGIVAAAAGSATIYILNPDTPILYYLLTAMVLVGMTSAACAINDYWDVEKDRIDHPDRPLPSRHLSLPQAWWAAIILFSGAILAALPLGFYPFLLVVVSTVVLWNYSHLLLYSGILGNLIVAAIISGLILLGSLVADRPFALLYPIGFLFCYALAKEIIWDIHDAEGDRSQEIVTIASHWGDSTAFSLAWGLLILLLCSIPIASSFQPMNHPLLFALFASLTILSLGAALIYYQRQRSDRAYQTLIRWERFSMVCGVFALLAIALPPLALAYRT